MTRALTLVELLASLALLSAIAAASLAVTRSATRTAAAASEANAWGRAADALLASIAADVAAGDFDPIGDRARGDPRVQVGEVAGAMAIIIRTRDARIGPCRRLYLFRSNQVEAMVDAAIGGAPQWSRAADGAVALGSTSDADCAIRGSLLIVRVVGPAGQQRAAAYVLSEGEEP